MEKKSGCFIYPGGVIYRLDSYSVVQASPMRYHGFESLTHLVS